MISLKEIVDLNNKRCALIHEIAGKRFRIQGLKNSKSNTIQETKEVRLENGNLTILNLLSVVENLKSQSVDIYIDDIDLQEDNLYIDYHYTTEDENKIFPELKTKEKELKALQEQLNEVESKMKELGLEYVNMIGDMDYGYL